ncbi:MAG: hypothetical protein WD824_08100 [Cyclobacteriaceae bacterium]
MYKRRLKQAATSLILLIVILPSAFSSNLYPLIKDDLLEDSVKASGKSDSTTKKTRTLFFGLTYGSNSSFLGRYQARILPYYSADISYKNKTGLFLSFLAYDINNSITFLDEVDVMAGWNVDLSKRVDASVFYTRYFFTESSELIKASVANTASASLGLDWGLLYSKITGYYIFGPTHDFFLVIDNSRYIEFPPIFRKDDYLALDPKITIITGTQTFVDTHYINQGTPLIRPGNGRPGGNPGSGGSTRPATTETSQTIFNVLSYEFSLPVSYNTGKFSFEITGRYSIPVNLLEGDTSAPQFFFTGGVVYFISSK